MVINKKCLPVYVSIRRIDDHHSSNNNAININQEIGISEGISTQSSTSSNRIDDDERSKKE